jgi:hypothetical protein
MDQRHGAAHTKRIAGFDICIQWDKMRVIRVKFRSRFDYNHLTCCSVNEDCDRDKLFGQHRATYLYAMSKTRLWTAMMSVLDGWFQQRRSLIPVPVWLACRRPTASFLSS